MTPSAPQPVLFGPFGFRLPSTAAKLLARLKRPGSLLTSTLFATLAAVGAASVALASQLVSGGGGPPMAGEALRSQTAEHRLRHVLSCSRGRDRGHG